MECASDSTLATLSAITDATTYPQNLTDYDPIFTDIDYLQNLLNNDRRKGNPGHRVFIDPKDPGQQFLVPITTFRFPGSTKDELKKGVCKPEELTREDKFIEKIYDTEKERTFTFINLNPILYHSWYRLSITLASVKTLFTQFDVQPFFIHICRTFGEKCIDRGEENENKGLFYSYKSQDGRSNPSFDVCYNLRYIEDDPSPAPGKAKWRTRKIGVYAKYFPHERRAVWIHIFPSARFSRRLKVLMERGIRGPMDVHLLHLRCASERFDHYIDYYERQIQELGRDALTTTENQTHIDARYSPSFTSIIEKMFQMVHFLQINKYAAEQLREMFQQFNRHGLKATRSTTQRDPLTNTESTVEVEVAEKYFHDASDEEYYFKHMNSYLAQTQQQEKRVKVLIDRANNFASLIPNMLNRQENRIMVQQAGSMKKISIITMIFLPPTFLAGLFSTVFANGKGLHMHPEGYYVYIPATIVLLIITFLGWRWYEKHTKHRESVTGCSEEVATVSDVAYSDAKTHSWWTMSTKPGECKDLEKQAGKTN